MRVKMRQSGILAVMPPLNRVFADVFLIPVGISTSADFRLRSTPPLFYVLSNVIIVIDKATFHKQADI